MEILPPCTHHWRLADAGGGGLVPACCLKCGSQKVFRSSHWVDDEPARAFRKAPRRLRGSREVKR